MENKKNIRVRAILNVNGSLLLIKRTRPSSTYWVFPGGKVEGQETMDEAIRRECREELGLEVKIRGFFQELESTRPGTTNGDFEHFYFCGIIGGKLGAGVGPEFQRGSAYEGTYKFKYIPIAELPRIDLRPAEIKKLLIDHYSPR